MQDLTLLPLYTSQEDKRLNDSYGEIGGLEAMRMVVKGIGVDGLLFQNQGQSWVIVKMDKIRWVWPGARAEGTHFSRAVVDRERGRNTALGKADAVKVLMPASKNLSRLSVKMEDRCSPLEQAPPLRGGDFSRHWGSIVRCSFCDRCGQRLDGTCQTIPRHGCILAEPASVSPGELL